MPPLPRAATPALQRQLRRALRDVFGLSELREGQHTVIERVMAGHPAIAVMPTGGGKSLCYQLPAVLLPDPVIVVSPLIALMKDQSDKLLDLGIAAVQCHSLLDAEAARAARDAIRAGTFKVLFTTPERLASQEFIEDLGERRIGLLVVDEAHCVSQWGHDFRPAFLEIRRAAGKLGNPCILALTATATPDVLEDVARQLGMTSHAVINTGVYRENLHYRVELVPGEQEKLERLLALVRESEGSGIVYCATVAAVDAVWAALESKGESVTRYHGRMRATERRDNQDAFMDGNARVMVATNAFGLGIDKADIRFVVHYQVPSGLDAYYQESGRAGRDGGTATCTLLFHDGDQAVQRFFSIGKYPTFEDVDAIYRALARPAPADGPWTAAALYQAIDRPRAKLTVALGLLRDQRLVASEMQPCRVCDNCLRIAEVSAHVQSFIEESPGLPVLPAHGFAPGDKVRVRRYGAGTVEKAEADSVTVAFGDGQRRDFLPRFVRAG